MLVGGIVAGWLVATVWHSGDIQKARQLPFVVRAYEGRMSPGQISAARADMRSAAETAGDCLNAQPEGGRNRCEPLNFLP